MTSQTQVEALVLQAIQHQTLTKNLNTQCSSNITDWGWSFSITSNSASKLMKNLNTQCSSDITDCGWSFSSTRNSASTLRKKPKYTMQQRHYRLGLKLQYDKQFGSSTKTTSNSALQQKPRQLASFTIEIQRIKCKEEKANHNSVHEGRTSSRYTALHIHGLFLLHNRLIEKRKKKESKGK